MTSHRSSHVGRRSHAARLAGVAISGAQLAVPTCPCCGQPVIPPGLPNLPPIKGRILEAVRNRPGIDTESLRAIVWADDPNGGPEDRKVIHVHVFQLNQRLRPHGIAVAHGRGLDGYRIRSLVRRAPPSSQRRRTRQNPPSSEPRQETQVENVE